MMKTRQSHAVNSIEDRDIDDNDSDFISILIVISVLKK